MHSTEHTPAPRVPLKLEVEYRRNYARSGEAGQLRNISITGAFLEHRGHTLKTDDKVNIEFNVGGRTRMITALIVWTNSQGCGVRFMPQNNRDVQIVDDLIYFVESKRESRRSVLDNIFKKVA